ncbi:50S ribosomal protein L3 [Candidatus Woesearchaeota archaeon]|nr:50S ribosomal protein L3 [Candidatus Woesearchaeota archaeon]
MHRPHRGSMQFWPRKRAKRAYARVHSWRNSSDQKLLGFLGYKAGMTHLLMKDTNPNSHTKNMQVSTAVTVIECPPLRVYGIRFYKNTEYGTKLAGEVFAKKNEKELSRKTRLAKKEGKAPDHFDDVRLIVYTQPKRTGIGKKKPELMEMAVGGKGSKEKAAFAESLLDKEIRVSEVLKAGQLVDIHSVTKGKGFQGTVKRFGVPIRQHKAEKTKRGIGTLGSWTPKRVQYTVAQPGKMGNHLRTEFNKLNLKVSDKPEEINPKGGFLHYGVVKNDYVLIKGSVPGSTKKLITLTEATRAPKNFKALPIELSYVSTESKQGA